MTPKEARQLLSVVKRIGAVIARLERTIVARDTLHRRQVAGLEARIVNLQAKLKKAQR